jgi:23S rRNA 5-hydroxycytidine C2501 synthase
MSFALGGRSGNRGLCAQPCRRLYSVKDEQDKTIVNNRYLLSLKDLNLSNYLEDLIDAGVRSFKIEGRLKDIPYVVNTVGFYRKLLDEIIAKKNLRKTSSGTAQLNFEPNLEKTFNRGYTDYGIKVRKGGFGSIDTPKSMGELVGVIREVGNNYFVIDGTEQLHNADGICFFDNEKNLSGTVVNRVEGKRVFPQKILEIHKGQEIYRNFDFELNRKLTGNAAERKIDISFTFRETEKGFSLAGIEEDDNQTIIEIEATKQPAVKREQARQTVITQLSKLGNTIFNCRDVKIETKDDYFLPVSKLNEGRRQLVEQLLKIRENNRPKPKGSVLKNNIEFPQKHLSYLGNVLNKKAQEFYHRHGVETIEQAAESGLDMSGKTVMKTKYCLREELGLCSPDSKSSTEPLILVDEDSREYEIKFLCGQCGMEIIYGRNKKPPQ